MATGGRIDREEGKPAVQSTAGLSTQQGQGGLLRCGDTTLTLAQILYPEIGWIQDMCYLACGLLVVVGSVPGRGLAVCNEDGQEIEHHLSQVHRRNRSLSGVCTDNRDGRVYVTESTMCNTLGYIHRHTPRGHHWTHCRITVRCWPDKVALTKDAKIILSDYDNNLHMYEISDLGDSHSIWCIRMSDQATSVCVTRDNTIVVCVGGRGVCLLDTNGYRLCTLDTGHTQIEPWGVCLDVCDDILVCDYKSNSLLLYDKKGEFIRNVLSLPYDEPVFVKLLEGKNVVVSDGISVCVYKM